LTCDGRFATRSGNSATGQQMAHGCLELHRPYRLVHQGVPSSRICCLSSLL
jgi:hypothetical protein